MNTTLTELNNRERATAPKPRRRDEAVKYLYGKGDRHFSPKQHFTVHQHNGTTVYETTDNRKAWEARYAKYIDTLNTGPDAPQAYTVWPCSGLSQWQPCKGHRIQDMVDKGILS